MKDLIKAHPSIIGRLLSIADDSEPLAEKKNPALAAAIAFAFGGVGLGLYLRSWRDFLIPFGILIFMLVCGVVTAEVLTLTVPFVWAAYAWRRVVSSNEKLNESGRTNRIIEAQIVCPPPAVHRPNKPSLGLKN